MTGPAAQLAEWIDQVVDRADNLVELGNRNACLSRPDGPWTRKVALEEFFEGAYNEEVLMLAFLALQLQVSIEEYEPMDARMGHEGMH